MRSSVIIASLLASLPMILAQATGFDPTSIPTSCLDSKCQDYINSVSTGNCADLSCLCTNTAANALESCLQCVVDAGIAGYDQTTLNNAINSFADGCKAAGHPVTISGVSGGGSSSPNSSPSASAPATASATHAQTTAGSGTTATAPATTAGGSVTKTNGAAGSSFHVGGLVVGAALAGAVIF